MKGRLLYLLKSYALTVVVFIVAKVAFMLLCREGHAFSVGDVWDVLMHGLSLDLSTALYLICLPFLLLIVNVWFTGGKWLIYSLRVYYLLIAFALVLAFVADTSLYPFWGFKLDASCLQYLDTPTEAMASVTTGYLLVRLLVLVLLTAVLTWAYWLCLPKAKSGSRKQKVAETILYIALIPLLIIGMRGGLSESTTNIGQVYFSQNQFLNHAAVNPVFSFLASFEKTASNHTAYHFMDDERCRETIDSLFTTESIGGDTLLNTQRPNIIVVLLEGCGGTFMEIGGRSDVMPNLNRLTREGIYFTQCYGNTWRTDRGTVCTWSGYPSFPTMSVMKMPAKTRTMPNIARTLSDSLDYHTYYLYGGDINFTNMRSYLVSGGFGTLKWKNDYSAEEQKTAQWGVCDSITFESLYDMASTVQEPFLIGYSTLSSHEPWDVPLKKMDDEILNAFCYLDQCIGTFVDALRQTPAWQNLLVVLLPDHGITYKDIGNEDVRRNHIPMVWTGGAVKSARHVRRICNQTDLPATLLGQLGIGHADFRYSRDVMSSNYTRPVAVHTYNNGITVVDSTGYAIFDLTADRMIQGEGASAEKLIHIGKAVLQSATQDLKNMK